ncbi:hypothetical protein [Ornithinimicrobium cerasi]|uniref:Uncharacterized protein n=1 Tax=Ornithinimicrobium cerasi TaxID=2248773 RepID=A0A285VIE6_9MICO|nr:hypothetical protein [Ornithinimicrobium cerasi]SOC53763.1 hypothetical protein SAMN05421879_102121 [Ornithinimicrobium cerasi]
MTVQDELEAVMTAGRWRDLRPYLLADAGSDPGRAARAWYRSRRKHWLEHYRWAGWAKEPEVDGRSALRVLALALGTPTQAADDLGRLTYGWRRGPADDLGVEVAVARGREFCQPFLEAASRLTFSKEDEWNIGWVARFGLPLVAAGVGDLPNGPAFGRGWASNFSRHGAEGALVDELRDSPAVAEGLAMAIASPDAMAHFEGFRRPGRELETAVAQLVAEGVLDRGRVLDGVLGALTRQDRAQSQKALARLLGALALAPADVAGRVPLVQQLLATARGPVTAVLLPVLLEAAGDQDLPAVAATVFARPEKAQRQALLRALTARDARWGRDARVQALTLAAELPDHALAERAARALADLGADAPVTAEVPTEGLWTEPPVVDEAGPARVVPPDEPSMTAALSRMTVAMDAADGAMLWDAAVRWARSDPRAVLAWARRSGERLGQQPLPSAVSALLDEPWNRVTAESHRELLSLVEEQHTGVRATFDQRAWKVVSRSTTQVLHDVLASEVRLRLGETPYLLSTPTRSDGTLDLATLGARLRGYGEHRVGPVDLFVALTRLEATAPARAVELDGISVGLWSPDPAPPRRLFSRASRSPADAVDLVRRWVAGGGLPAPVVRHRDGTVALDAPTLPVPRSAFRGLPPSLEGGHEDGVHEPYFDWSLLVETDAGMLPGWADLLAARLQRSFDQKGRFAPLMLPSMVASPRPGAAVVHAVTATLSHADEDRRLLAVDAALTLMGRGRWDPADHTACCEHLLASGELRLGRLAHSWEQLILAGALRPLWPTAVTVLERACAADRKPAGLAELLGMLRRYVPAVPDVVVPGSVAALASSRGSSKARAEAAAFVEAAA